jgi:hypothetical protein
MQVRNLYNADDVVGCCFSFWIPVVSKLRAEPLQLETGPTSLAEPERAR